MNQEESKTIKLKEYIALKKELHEKILNFLDDEEDSQYTFDQLIQIVSLQNITQNRNEFREFINLIKKIYSNHHRSQEFQNKIIQIILHYSKEIKQTFPNLEIFQLFENYKMILSLLIQNKIVKIDKTVAKYITLKDTEEIFYFFPKIKKYIDTKTSNKIMKDILTKYPDMSHKTFKKKCEIGENDSYLCQLIRDDNVQEFISYVNKSNIPLDSRIKNSIFETNPLFKENIEITIIRYAAFFGSIQIIKYLVLNNVPLKKSLWIYAIHSNNAELIHYLEENNVKPPDKIRINTGILLTRKYFKGNFTCPYGESIRCHHKSITRYIEDNYLEDKSNTKTNDFLENFIINSYNYEYFPNRITDQYSFFSNLCLFDYCKLVEFFFKEKGLKSSASVKRFIILIRLIL
ncbi:hypothetical protein M9Y10_032692 [Tritrichomonas musculus]|uniref:DUF3447 domain-containing protein n=1 Tax=Tritrichomonas musculus TaxID=1915356 RepID=A0ABR2GYF5_9EUKA